MRFVFNTLFIITFALLLTDCARISTPTGGPEDETPPILIRSVPENGQTNYTGNTILLSFDERIQTQSIETELIITPKPTGSFRTRVNKNNVLLTFFEPFSENTTYSFAFASTIQDVTNRNAATDINLSFSTGDFIDSLRIQGKIIDLYTQEPAENVLVSLYSASDSLDILSGSASYYSKTDTSGIYQFQNLPGGAYRIYANDDKNNNSKADSEGEKYGFYPDTLLMDQSLSDINFTIQRLSTSKLRTLSARNFGRYYDVTFNKAITDFEVITPDQTVFRPLVKNKVRFYRNTETLNDSTDLIFTAQDSLGTILTDTVNYYFVESRLDPDAFTYTVSPDRNGMAPIDSITLHFTKPVKSVNLDNIFFQLDTINSIPIDTSSSLRWNSYKTEISIPIDLPSLLGDDYNNTTFTLTEAAFISIENDSSASLQKNISILSEEETAVISGTIQSSYEHIIVQLLDSRSLKVLRESHSREYKFEYLPAGRYLVRVIADLNHNGKWDIGNILNNQIPEPVKFYYDDFYNTKIIEVRKNWEQSDTNVSF